MAAELANATRLGVRGIQGDYQIARPRIIVERVGFTQVRGLTRFVPAQEQGQAEASPCSCPNPILPLNFGGD